MNIFSGIRLHFCRKMPGKENAEKEPENNPPPKKRSLEGFVPF
jgi:hypothetical protein